MYECVENLQYFPPFHHHTAGEDYYPIYEVVILNPRSTEVCVHILTIEDTLLEGEEQFRLEVSFNNDCYYPYYVEIEVNTVDIIISDDESTPCKSGVWRCMV